VTFKTARFLDAPSLGIEHDGAYWLSDIVGADAHRYADIDLTTHACGGALPVVTQDAPGAGEAPLPWYSHSASVSGTTPIATEPKLTGTLRQAKTLTVDAAATCLAGKPLAYAITSDVPAKITLSDGRTIELKGDGEQSGTLPAPNQRVTVTDPTGTSKSYVSARADTSYHVYRSDEPEAQVCQDGDSETYASPSGSGPTGSRQGYTYAGQRDGCSQSDPQTGTG
jgi:hypothetical protein